MVENGTHNTTCNVDSDEQPAITQGKPQKERQLPRRLIDYVLVLDNEDDNGEMIHFSMFVDFEPVDYQEELKEKNMNDSMVEELIYKQNNKTWELIKSHIGKKDIDVR